MYFAYLSHSVPVHTGIKGRQVHPLIRFLLQSWGMRSVHAMAILQVHQAKALKQMHKGSPDPGLMHWGLCPAVLGGAEADRSDPAHPAPAWYTVSHRCPRDQASVCSSPWAPSCVLQSCSPHVESTPRPHVGPLAGLRCHPRPSRAPGYPGNQRSGPDVGNLEMLEFVLSQETARTASLLPRRRAG